MSPARRFVVSGRVQMVGFRMHVESAARRAGAAGWVRNRSDGTVEAVVAGSQDAVAAVEDAIRRGPRGARVEAVDVSDTSFEGDGFDVR